MNREDQITLMIADSIIRVLELCFQQNVTTTWRDIFLFLRFPPETWKDDMDLDEKIYINTEEDLDLMRTMIMARFSTKH